MAHNLLVSLPKSVAHLSQSIDGQIAVLDLLVKTGLVPSKGEARRLIQQGGVSIDDQKVTDVMAVLPLTELEAGHKVIRKGKKVFHKVTL